ncbi:hypothetical protein BT69DRAFT_1315886 [Atractiella rhizophila]|nr:hypothetical protein BT69DRAFT_1315886 [Atractiella rhizophila]
MSVNWTMISPVNRQPVPLPNEKFFISIAGIDLTLRPCSTTSVPSPAGAGQNAYGVVHLSNQRVVFITDSPNDKKEGEEEEDKKDLESLSIPIGNFQDGRFEQPWFGANYYEASVVPVSEGGLQGLQQVKFSFKEGQAWRFYEVMEEIKSLYTGGAASSRGEDLPAYEPLDAAPLPVASGSGSNVSRGPMPERRNSIITDEDLDVARIAREEEERENELNMRHSIQLERVRQGEHGGDDSMPPAYS